MTDTTDICAKVKALTETLLSPLGLELVDIEYVREGRSMILRIFIDKPSGVTLDDCADVSRELSLLLDLDEALNDRYTLEVSSPGLNRPLKKLSDYSRYSGKLAKVKTRILWNDDAGNPRKTFLGILQGIESDCVIMNLTEGQTARIPFIHIVKAHLEFEL